MGAVFEAEHLHLGKRVALKTLPGLAAGDARAIERFLREGRAAARVRHPHVVDVTDVGVEDGVPYLVMELLEGEDLAARLRRTSPLPLPEALEILLPVVAAVDAMHRCGVVHRDLKPENLFLARELGRVVPRVVDFGVSRPDRPEAASPSAHSGLVGTPFYLSPEQVDGARGDARSDQHALGVIAYECLAGRRPYEAPTLLGLLALIRDGRCDPLAACRPELPEGLADAIARAMRTAPADRFESARAFGDALARHAPPRAAERWRELTSDASPAARHAVPHGEPRDAVPGALTRLDGSPLVAAEESAPAGFDTPSPRPRRRGVAALVGGALVLGGASLVAWSQRPAPPPAPWVPPTLPAPARATPPTVVIEPSAPPTPPDGAVTVTVPTPRNTRALAPRRPARVLAVERAVVTAPAEPAPLPVRAPAARDEPPPLPPARPVVNGAPIVD